MPRLGRFPQSRPVPATFARGLMFVAVILLHGTSSAQEAPGPRDASQVDQAAEEEKRKLLEQVHWEEGPGTADLGEVAQLRVSRGHVFTGPEGGKIFLEVLGGAAPKNLLGVLAPGEDREWFLVFEFVDYIKGESGPGKLDPDSLLEAFRRDTDEQNRIRRERGLPEFENIGWERPPSYDRGGKTLTWVTRCDVDGERVVNYNVRVFGRPGAIDATLVTDPEDLDRVVPTLTNILTLLEFKDEQGEGGGRGDGDSRTTYGTGSGSRRGSYPMMLGRSRAGSRRLIGGAAFGLISLIFGVYRKLRPS